MEIVAPAFLGVALWWFAIICALAGITYAAENGAPGRATVIMMGTFLILQFLSPIQPFTLLVTHPVQFVGAVMLYFALGAGYGVVKWYSYVRGLRDQFLKLRVKYQEDRRDPANAMDRVDLKRMDEWVLSRMSVRASEMPPQIANNKARFFTWMAYWPMSAGWTLLNDPVRRIFNAIYTMLAKKLQAISNSVFHGIDVNR